MQKLKLIVTEDGSHSLYRQDMNETYHSFHGAKGESSHVFIDQGLDYLHKKGLGIIHVFEVGLGTGLNALLAAIFAQKHQVQVNYYSVEPEPVPVEIYTQLNYPANEHEEEVFLEIHQSDWEQEINITDYFSLTKLKRGIEEIDTVAVNKKFDVIFFDAFAPSKQAGIWSVDILKKCHDLLSSGGILTTYCAQGQFKRNLTSVGFKVESLRGAMGKKEMVRGIRQM